MSSNPYTWAQVSSHLATAILALGTGYFFGMGYSLFGDIGRGPANDMTRKEQEDLKSVVKGEEPGAVSEDESSDEEEIEGLDGVKASWAEECKLVLVVRSDLGMSKGKIAAQCSHATLACYKTLQASNPSLLRHWELRSGQAKVALKCDSEDEMLLLKATALSLNICARDIKDAGRTQIAAGSRTVLGIGPAPVRLINQVTGHLKLL